MDNLELIFVGDFNTASPQSICMGEKLRKIISCADIKCVNFEGALPLGELSIANKTILRQSMKSPSWCESNGFNLISLANNHMFDFGIDGLVGTKKSFKVDTIGAGIWDEVYKIHYVNIKNIKVGFFSGTAADLASLKDDWTDKDAKGCAWINHRSVNRLISEGKSNCDFLFVISHGGAEYMNLPLPEWRDRYRELIDYGADGIIASHPHVPQGWEYYKNRPIIYSLGNFYFDLINRSQPIPQFWNTGLIVKLTIDKAKNTINLEVKLVERSDNSIEIVDTLESQKYLEEICSYLDNTNYLRKVDEECLSLYNVYLDRIIVGTNSIKVTTFIKTMKNALRCFLKGKLNNKLILHQIRNEDNRWVVARALKIKSKTTL